jgi:ELWxxDGT repeat protein
LEDRILFVNAELSKRQRRTLYASEGDPDSAKIIPGIPAKAYPNGVTNMVASDGWAYFHTEKNLWVTRGDADSTSPLVDIASLGSKILSSSLRSYGDGVLFRTENGALWQAKASTGELAAVDWNLWPNFPEPIYPIGNRFVYTATTYDTVGVWSTDGTAAGKVMVSAIPSYNQPQGAVFAHGLLWFAIIQPAGGRQLWRSDGSSAGTFPVYGSTYDFGTVTPGPDGKVLFTAASAASGSELWISDGTAAGTELLLDIAPGIVASYPSDFALVGNTVYFAADDGVHGRELWKTDGTVEGTVMAADVTGDTGSSSPGNVTLIGQRLFFDASTLAAGREVYALDVSADLAP